MGDTALDGEMADAIGVQIGEAALAIDDTGIHDAVSGEDMGGFATDAGADQCLNDVENTLYEQQTEVPDASAHVETSQNDNFNDTSFPDELGQIQPPDTDGFHHDVEAGGEDNVDIPGAESAVESGGAAAAEEVGAEAALLL